MRILVQLSHPAHFHYYHRAICNWQDHGHQVFVLIKTKDILEELVKSAGIPYVNINPVAHRNSKMGILWDMIVRDWRVFRTCLSQKIDILTGSTSEIAQIGWLLHKPAVCTGEDDAAVVPAFVRFTAPFLQVRLTPVSCNNGVMEPKTIKYASFHELAYLHPHHFSPDPKYLDKYGIGRDEKFFILRFASLKAHHDAGIHGIDNAVAAKLVEMLRPYGRVFITSERTLDTVLEPFRMAIDAQDIHHVMAFASLYIGDSQTMAAEAAVMGVPFVRFNDFVGRIGYLNELEEVYRLGYGIRASEKGARERLFSVVKELLDTPDRKAICAQRRQKMLSEKIDYAQFLTWFIENYPESREIMRTNPDYQWRFR